MEKRYKWEDLVKMYPDKWLALKDCTYDGSTIRDAILIAVFDGNEVFEFEKEHLDDDYEYERTTDGHFSGVINLDNAEISIR